MNEDKVRIHALENILRECLEHLDYCNWGDAYERECARDSKLPERARAILVEVGS